MAGDSFQNPADRGRWSRDQIKLEERLQGGWLTRESLVLLFHLWLSDRVYGTLSQKLDLLLQQLAAEDVLDRDVLYKEGSWKGRVRYRCKDIEELRAEMQIYDAKCRLSDDPEETDDDSPWQDLARSLRR